jgi:hypothetical protein
MFTDIHLMAQYTARKSKMSVISELCYHTYGSATLARMTCQTCRISLLARSWGVVEREENNKNKTCANLQHVFN